MRAFQSDRVHLNSGLITLNAVSATYTTLLNVSMATDSSKVTLTGLARRFVDDGLLDEATAKDAFIQASNNRIPLITYLVQNQLAAIFMPRIQH